MALYCVTVSSVTVSIREGSEVLKIAVRDDKCRCGATILAGAEVMQGDQGGNSDRLKLGDPA